MLFGSLSLSHSLSFVIGDGAQCRSSLFKRGSVSKSAAVGHYDTFPKSFSDVSSVCGGSHIDYSTPNISLLLKEVWVGVCVCVQPEHMAKYWRQGWRTDFQSLSVPGLNTSAVDPLHCTGHCSIL